MHTTQKNVLLLFIPKISLSQSLSTISSTVLSITLKTCPLQTLFFSDFFPLSRIFIMDPETQEKYASNGKVMFGSTILLFLIVIIVVFVHTFRDSCFRRHRHAIRTVSSVAFNEGLCPSVLKFLPTFTYSSDTHRSIHDCAVCLSEFADGEEGRFLPNCNHAFHAHCVDIWFHSHSNCPLCRTPVRRYAAPVQPSSDTEPGSVGLSSYPAPVWCPRKSLELVGMTAELEQNPVSEPGHGSTISRVGN